MRQSAVGPLMLGGLAAILGAAAGLATGGAAAAAAGYVLCGAAGVVGGGLLNLRAADPARVRTGGDRA